MIQLYTIGFTNKSAEQFFTLLRRHDVSTIVDTRVNNVSQLAGFAKGADLAFFARELGHIGYEHKLDFAPTKELLNQYRNKEIGWPEYETAYLNLLDMRKVGQHLVVEQLHQQCLLCSEHTPEHCHRRLLAEYLQHRFSGIEVVHLIR
jgi:uncharacterized protein (DUF488 family)